MTSLVVEGDTLLVTQSPITVDPDSGIEFGAGNRISILDRASGSLISEIDSADGRPHVRAVSATHIAFITIEGGRESLRLAPRSTGTVTDSTVLVDDLALGSSPNNPTNKVWLQGDTLFFQESAGLAMGIRSVPAVGGAIIRYQGLVRDVIEFGEPLLVFGAVDEFTLDVQLFHTSASGDPPAPVGVPVAGGLTAPWEVQSDGDLVYLLQDINGELTLYRVTRAGADPEILGTYGGSILGSGPPGFVLFTSRRYLDLLPLSGDEPTRLADLGDRTEPVTAVFGPAHLLVVASARLSDYLLEIELP